MLRRTFIERTLRQIYGGQPSQDRNITDNLVNTWLIDATGIAAKKNYTDNFQLEGVGFVNNGFYSTFKGISVTPDETGLYKFTLPSIPLGIGAVDGVSRILFKSSINELSYPGVLLSENQVGIQRQMRPIPNKILCYSEGVFCFAITSIIMNHYTVNCTMISSGDSTNLNSELNLPPDYLPICVEYIKSQLGFERAQVKDAQNDGSDAIKTT